MAGSPESSAAFYLAIFVVLLFLIYVYFSVKYNKWWVSNSALRDLDAKQKQARDELHALMFSFDQIRSELKNTTQELHEVSESRDVIRKEISITRDDLKHCKKELIDMLSRQAILQNEVTAKEVDLYQKVFPYSTEHQFREKSDQIKTEIKNWSLLKNIIIDNYSPPGYEMEEKKLKKIQSSFSKLMLKLFSVECENAILRITWKNITTLSSSIKNSFSFINTAGSLLGISLPSQLETSRQKQLRVLYEWSIFEYDQKESTKEDARRKREEAMEQKIIEEQVRQEEIIAQAIKKEIHSLKQDLMSAEKAAANAIEEVIRLKEKALEIQNSVVQRKKSNAESTRKGYVYIISNAGSFGDRMVKIGLTRRFDPMERVYELGDASVPFAFDVHALIPSDDAPRLEHMLHKAFAEKAVNLINKRKEFFYTTPREIELEISKNVEIKSFLAEEKSYFSFDPEFVCQDFIKSNAMRQGLINHQEP